MAGQEMKLGIYAFRTIKVGTILGGISAAYNYKKNYDKGESIPWAATKALGQFAISQAVPWVGWAGATYLAAKGITRAFGATENRLAAINSSSTTGFGQTFADTLPVATMRQASKMAISNNQLSARYIMGNEARLMNRG
jgi:hypothetical protein